METQGCGMVTLALKLIGGPGIPQPRLRARLPRIYGCCLQCGLQLAQREVSKGNTSHASFRGMPAVPGVAPEL